MSSVLDETSIRTSRPGLTQANGSRSLVRPLGRHGRRTLTYATTGRRALSRRMNADADDQRHWPCDEYCWLLYMYCIYCNNFEILFAIILTYWVFLMELHDAEWAQFCQSMLHECHTGHAYSKQAEQNFGNNMLGHQYSIWSTQQF